MEVFATIFLEEKIHQYMFEQIVWKSWKQQLKAALLQHFLNKKALAQNVEKHNG